MLERVGPRAWVGWGEEPALPPIVAVETTDYGWRGVTADGEVYEMRSETGEPPTIPESISVTLRSTGDLLGWREIDRKNVVDISGYLSNFQRSATLHRACDDEAALDAIERAIAVIDTSRARFNRGMILLSLGRWHEGFAEFENCERTPPFQRPGTRALIQAGAVPWRGESLAGKRLLLVHDHGFGDTIMCLRYVRALNAMGADIVLSLPAELRRIGEQFAPVADGPVEFDYFASFLHVLRWLDEIPEHVPTGTYIKTERGLVRKWRERIGAKPWRKVGVAWSVRVNHPGDFPRALPLADIINRIHAGSAEAQIFSMQKQDCEEAERLGVRCYGFEDFADCAALMSLMDEIVSVDTAAIHLAGALGHPRATLLLNKWHSWRWHGNPFYPDVTIREI